MKKLKICCIFGTRPEIIKMAPVIHGLQKLPNIETHVICSGQHRELLYPLIDWFELKVDKNMDVMQIDQDLNQLSSKIIADFGVLFKKERYDCIFAQGDTTTVLMTAIAAFYSNTLFAHIEAGLRTYNRNLPFPEEMNRVLVGKLAMLHFAPTTASANNLIQEGVNAETILVTGNTVIDALYYTVDKLGIDRYPNIDEKIILVTAHRRENFGKPLQRICNALLKIAEKHADVTIIFPVHPNPNVREVVYKTLGHVNNIHLIEPLPYKEMVQIMAKSYLVVTDSGGLQEEAPALRKPVLILRDETERPEITQLGGAQLVGSNEKLIVASIEQLLTDELEYKKMILGYSPYGSGKASELIIKKTLAFLAQATAIAEII